MSVKVQDIKLSRLLPDPYNVNTHSDVNVSQIKASIQRFGFLDPMGVVPSPDRRGYYVIVEGHGRYEAAAALEMETVPCLVLSLDDASRRGYAIAHNQTQQLSVIDQVAVTSEFERLGVEAGDYFSLGYNQDDVMFLMSPARGGHDMGHGAGIGTADGPGPTDIVGTEAPERASGPAGFVPTVHRTSLSFASEQSYNRFVHVLSQLRDRYPTAGTIGERIVMFLNEHNLATVPAAAE